MTFQLSGKIDAKAERCEIVWPRTLFRSTKNYVQPCNKGFES